MWRRMYECHQVQNHISQQLNHLVNQHSMEPTTEYNLQAAAQLKTEVTSWYDSLCKLIKFQREYVNALCRWIQLTNCLVDDGQGSISSSGVHSLSEQWLIALDKLPDKVIFCSYFLFFVVCRFIFLILCPSATSILLTLVLVEEIVAVPSVYFF